MNRLTKFNAGEPLSPAAPSPSAPVCGGGATFRFRDDGCQACSGFGYTLEPSGPGYVSVTCEECEGLGEIDCACAECGNVYPINDDGLCRYCHDGRHLTTVQMHEKWLCANVLRQPSGRIEL